MKLQQKTKKRMIKLDYIRGIEKLLKDRKINYRIIKKIIM